MAMRLGMGQPCRPSWCGASAGERHGCVQVQCKWALRKERAAQGCARGVLQGEQGRPDLPCNLAHVSLWFATSGAEDGWRVSSLLLVWVEFAMGAKDGWRVSSLPLVWTAQLARAQHHSVMLGGPIQLLAIT